VSKSRGKKSNERGFTLVEIFVTLSIGAVVLVFGLNSYQSFSRRAQIGTALRTVTVALNTARFHSVHKNRKIKVYQQEGCIVLMAKEGGVWQVYQRYDAVKDVVVTMNNGPVFSPFGSVAPLCSVTVESNYYRYKVSLSMAGRVLVTAL